ncbi:SDR family NAD(P)-dependent oxidoreductase [Lutimaribacter marinistellae]|uniref:SDR family NAD(P)-dependent oxidoreductase n=1 Tax=Lutimaribacter marinistellae TaxID=1820329 RepID=A0ABV7TIX2_9RHOB
MSRFRDKVAVVTGAGSGIGRALAQALAARGARAVVVADIDGASAGETAEMVRASGAEAMQATLDVAEMEAFSHLAQTVRDRFGVVHQLYNNAGIAQGAQPFVEIAPEQVERVLRVNLFGVLNGTRAFLPLLIESGDAHLVNISSLNGLMAQGEGSIYCTSKFAVRGFTESVRIEMLMAGHKVEVIVVHPGGVRTNIATASRESAGQLPPDLQARAEARERVYNEKLLTMPAEDAVKEMLDGIEKGRSRIVITGQARFIDRLIRFMPESYPRRVVEWQRKTFG